jgi:hypothetical protein
VTINGDEVKVTKALLHNRIPVTFISSPVSHHPHLVTLTARRAMCGNEQTAPREAQTVMVRQSKARFTGRIMRVERYDP